MGDLVLFFLIQVEGKSQAIGIGEMTRKSGFHEKEEITYKLQMKTTTIAHSSVCALLGSGLRFVSVVREDTEIRVLTWKINMLVGPNFKS